VKVSQSYPRVTPSYARHHPEYLSMVIPGLFALFGDQYRQVFTFFLINLGFKGILKSFKNPQVIGFFNFLDTFRGCQAIYISYKNGVSSLHFIIYLTPEPIHRKTTNPPNDDLQITLFIRHPINSK